MRASQEFLKACVAVFGMLLSGDRLSADCYTLTYGYVNGDPSDTGATGSWFSSAYRLNGNEVYMYSNTGVSGPNAPLVITHVKSAYYRNGTLAIGPTTYDGRSGGATVTGYYWQYLFYSGQYYLGDFQVGHSPGNLNDHWGTSPYCESLGYHPIYVHHSDVSNIYTAVKPTIEVTGDPSNPKSTRWAFWYLAGAPSIDGYYTQVSLTGHTKWGASDTSPISWSVPVGGLKVRLSSTSGGQTLVTSLTPSASSPSAGYVYDVSVQISTDGLPSDSFPLSINAPVYVNRTYLGPEVITGGWQDSFAYTMFDLAGGILSPITLHETLENQKLLSPWVSQPTTNPYYSNWLLYPPIATAWSAGNWTQTKEFVDTLYAKNPLPPSAPLVPQPVLVGSSPPVDDISQKFFVVGSGAVNSASGVCVYKGKITYLTDHGEVSGGTPLSQTNCALGLVGN